jgi:hypothetical protein
VQIRVRNARQEVSAELREYAERQLRLALGRYGPRVAAVTLVLEETPPAPLAPGPSCRLEVSLVPGGRLVLTAADHDLHAAVAWLAARAGQAVSRALARRRSP